MTPEIAQLLNTGGKYHNKNLPRQLLIYKQWVI